MNPNSISNLFQKNNTASGPITGEIPTRNDALMAVSVEATQTNQSKNRRPAFVWGIHRWGNERMRVSE